MRAQNGWQKRKDQFMVQRLRLEVIPSRWEEILAKLEIDEHEALRQVERRTPAGELLRTFIELECARRYVPEDVLLLLGMQDVVERSVSLDWGTLRYQPKVRRGHAAPLTPSSG
jgi:hypothetical protein